MPDPALDSQSSPQHIGPFRILDVLGEGGMGVVYLAEQREPVRRRVALKVIKPGMDSKQVIARFELERQTLAVMNHPAIAKVFDAGTTDTGQPYFVMEFVEGIALTDYCDEHKLTLKQRIVLFQKLCRGVHHAHQKGVLHRDLKPAHTLVGRRDDRHEVKIIDFGLARATNQQLIDQTIYTEHGQLIGTPEYMSPEQAGGNAVDIDARTDIYSLGVMLYELLAGEKPFSSAELRRAGLLEVQRMIRDEDPQSPSTKISSVGEVASEWAHKRRLTPATLRKNLRGDLDWIIMQAMAKEPERRYESAAALAQDLERYLRHEPVTARPPSATYRLKKFVRRNPAKVVAIFAAAAAAVVFAIQASQNAVQQQRMLDFMAAEALCDQEERLYPIHPENVARMRRWLARAEDLLARRAGYESEQDRAAATAPPTGWEREEMLANMSRLVKLRPRVATAAALAESLDRISRIEARAAWQSAQASIAAEAAYGGLELEPVLGLVPLRQDPQSKLWEFWFVASGARPAIATGASGYDLTPASGIVLVLLPGGEFEIGSPTTEVGRMPNENRERVRLAPFFLAKHEVTQGQWERVMGANPSAWRPGVTSDVAKQGFTARNPVEQVSWFDCVGFADRIGLALPTEAQWEYACRAGSDRAFHWGEPPESLQDRTNLLDLSSRRAAGTANWNDGFVYHAPVGTFAANRFGLFDMHGNVSEWVRDAYVKRYQPFGGRPGDGFQSGGGDDKVFRGGSWYSGPVHARSAFRNYTTPHGRNMALGCRVMLPLDQPVEGR